MSTTTTLMGRRSGAMRRPKLYRTNTPYDRNGDRRYALSSSDDVVLGGFSKDSMPKFFFRKKKTVFDGLLLAKPVIVVEDDTTSTAAVVVRGFTPSLSDWRKIFYVPLEGMSVVVVVFIDVSF